MEDQKIRFRSIAQAAATRVEATRSQVQEHRPGGRHQGRGHQVTGSGLSSVSDPIRSFPDPDPVLKGIPDPDPGQNPTFDQVK